MDQEEECRLTIKRAALLAEKAAEQGNVFAQTGLAGQYEQGLGVSQNLAKAAALYQRAAEQGNARAQIGLAQMYSKGRGVSKDKKKAAELFEKAADQGDPNAQTNLGWMYRQGDGVARNYRKAVELYQKAADQGYAPGQAYLASCYAEGKGVTKHYQKAVELFHKAVAQGQSANAFNDFAWFLATCPDQSQRNGKEAIIFANKACQLSGWKEANFIGTLAAAFAEFGDFDAAVRYQQQAMAIGSDYPDKQTMEKSLQLYKQRTPYRE
jgi:TPR repeat protein